MHEKRFELAKSLVLTGLAAAGQAALVAQGAEPDKALIASGGVIAGAFVSALINRLSSKQTEAEHAALAERSRHLRRGMAKALRDGLEEARDQLDNLPLDPYDDLFKTWFRLLDDAANHDSMLESLFPVSLSEPLWEAVTRYEGSPYQLAYDVTRNHEKDAAALAGLLRQYLTVDLERRPLSLFRSNLHDNWVEDQAIGFARRAVPYYRKAFATSFMKGGPLSQAFTFKVMTQLVDLAKRQLDRLERIEKQVVDQGKKGRQHTTKAVAPVLAKLDEIHGDFLKLQPREEPLHPQASVPSLHQVPPPPGDFTGREAELRELLDAVHKQGVTILGVRGMGGVGKTALALKLAEQLAPEFPDAQLLLHLKGVSKQPASTRDVMEQVILALLPGQKLPADEDLRPHYLSSLHGKRALILMDNAKDEQQVEALVPPAGCILLITSRQRFLLPGLYAKDLSSLSRQEARTLLLRIAPRIEGYEEALARLSGDLPLALRTAAKVIANRVDLTPGEYVQRLSEGRETLEPVEASLGLSYDLLVPDVQRQFSALAVFPDTFDVQGAAAVWRLETDAAQAALGELLKHNLVDWDPGESRYRLHDMSRKFADDCV